MKNVVLFVTLAVVTVVNLVTCCVSVDQTSKNLNKAQEKYQTAISYEELNRIRLQEAWICNKLTHDELVKINKKLDNIRIGRIGSIGAVGEEAPPVENPEAPAEVKE